MLIYIEATGFLSVFKDRIVIFYLGLLIWCGRMVRDLRLSVLNLSHAGSCLPIFQNGALDLPSYADLVMGLTRLGLGLAWDL